MSTATDRNRQIVAEGLEKRANARKLQELHHEDMRRSMFETIDAHSKEAYEQRCKDESKKAQEAAMKLAVEVNDKRLCKLNVERLKGVRRAYGAVAYAAINCILYSVGGIKFWVAIPVVLACALVAFAELIAAFKRAPALHRAYKRKEELNERV